jgi:mono/diheme cytochrome c family protein
MLVTIRWKENKMQSRKVRAFELTMSLVFLFTVAFVNLRAQTAGDRNPLEPTEKNVALGLDHFDAHCARCHGMDGKAATEKGRAVRAADLTSSKIQSKSDADLFRVISDGVKGTAMPAFSTTHEPTEIWQTILLLRRLPTLTPEQRAKLEAAIPAAQARRDSRARASGRSPGHFCRASARTRNA